MRERIAKYCARAQACAASSICGDHHMGSTIKYGDFDHQIPSFNKAQLERKAPLNTVMVLQIDRTIKEQLEIARCLYNLV